MSKDRYSDKFCTNNKSNEVSSLNDLLTCLIMLGIGTSIIAFLLEIIVRNEMYVF